jgi:thioesterase domain-containing protein
LQEIEQTCFEMRAQEMKRVQPGGPFNIGGYSAGIVIAFEMISQLNLIHGDEVRFC